MATWGRFYIVGLWATFVVFLAVSKSSGTFVRTVATPRAQETQRVQRRTAARYHYATVSYQPYTGPWRTTTMKPKYKHHLKVSRGKKHWKYASNGAFQLNG